MRFDGARRRRAVRRFTGVSAAVALAAFLIAAALSGCGDGDTSGPETRDEIVLFAYLYIGEAVSDENAFLLTRTRPVGDPYDPEEAAIRDAVVTLRTDTAAVADTLDMVRPGYYSNPAISIEPFVTYHMRAEIPGEDPVTATTTTPAPFTILAEPLALPDSMVHATIPDSFPILLTCDVEDQIFQVDAYCLEEWQDARYVTTIGDQENPEGFDEYGGENGEPRHIAPYFRVRNLEQEDGAYRIGWYGDLMVFYGTYDITVLSIDDNYFNWLYRDNPELYGGVVGGIGVFGSACRAQWRVEAIE